MPNDSPLSSSSEHATEEGNTRSLDIPTAILVWEVPENERWVIENGETAKMTAETTAGNSGPAGGNADPTVGTDFGLAFREKNTLMGQWTTFASFPVDTFNALSQVEQIDGKGEEGRTVEFDEREISDENGNAPDAITLDPGDQIAVVTDGDDTIDPGLYFEIPRTVHSL